MAILAVGDLIVDNLRRRGVVLARTSRPERRWLLDQDDLRMRIARGPWWDVGCLDGGSVVVPESLASRLRRANIDDLAQLVDTEEMDGGASTMRHLFEHMTSDQRSKRRSIRRTPPNKSLERTRGR
jgi:hypothetical protein